MNEFEINVLPINILRENVDIYFSAEEKEGYQRIYKKNLPQNFFIDSKYINNIFFWWSLTQGEGDIKILVNLFENKKFAKHYFNKIIFDHFSSQNILTNRNFISDTEVYIEDASFSNSDYKKYNHYSLRVDNNDLVGGTSLLVSYDGSSLILRKSFSELQQLDISNLNKVCFAGKITKFKFLSEEEKKDIDNIYPIINPNIRSSLNLPYERNYSENKYKKYYEALYSFYGTYLKNVIIGESIRFFESGFYRPHEEKIKQTSEDSNLLLFGGNRTNFVPYIGLKEYGPFESMPLDKRVKFIFIFHEDDRDFANKIYSYLKKGYKSFPGLESFVNIKFEIDTARSIQFTEHNPISQIQAAIQGMQFESNVKYAAFYISRIKKDSQEEEYDEVYYKLKEILLQHTIVSQVIFKEKINDPAFNYYLPNIAIALLAKLGGKPWRLYRAVKNDLIIGIGADRSHVSKNTFVGMAFCFKNDGTFKGFNAFEKSNTEILATSIQQSIEEYIAENINCERLIIHYYKSMSYEEEEPIRKLLEHLNLRLPYVILTINSTESKDYVLFDSSFDGKMPQSGTFIKTKPNELIICNNTRYSHNTATRIDGFPLPIKIKFKTYNYEKINDPDIIRELVDQVYQFSRMYWKSVRQRTKPVTIEYSELVAKMLSHFENKELNQFARNSLWFL